MGGKDWWMGQDWWWVGWMGGAGLVLFVSGKDCGWGRTGRQGRTVCGWGGWVGGVDGWVGQDCRVGLVGGAGLPGWTGGWGRTGLAGWTELLSSDGTIVATAQDNPSASHHCVVHCHCSKLHVFTCLHFLLPFLSHIVFLFLFSLSVRIWDIRPFAPSERQLKLLEGAQHSFEKVGHCTCPS